MLCLRRCDRTDIAFIVQAKEFNQARYTFRPLDIITHPSSLWKDVMKRCSSCCNKLLAHRHRKRKVSLPVAMQMSNFMTIDAKLYSTKAMREFFYVWPTHDFVFY